MTEAPASPSRGTKELDELVDGLGVVANTAVAVFANKKVDAGDLSHVVSLFGEAKTLVNAVKGLSDLDDEIKDLDQAELLALGSKVWSMVKEIKQTYEENK